MRTGARLFSKKCLLLFLGFLVSLFVIPVTSLLERQVNVAVDAKTMAKLDAIEKSEGTKPTAFARVAIAEKLAGRTSETARLAAELTRLTGDVTAPTRALRDAIAEVERDAAMSAQSVSKP